MDAAQLKEFKTGQEIMAGLLFPGMDEEEIIWTATSVLPNAKRKTKKGTEKFMYVRFDLTYLGILVGEIEASERPDGSITWRSLQ
jgi:hypothetical protein